MFYVESAKCRYSYFVRELFQPLFVCLPVIDKCVHENLLFYNFLELRFFHHQFSVVVIGDYNGPGFAGQVEDVTIIMTDKSSAKNLT